MYGMTALKKFANAIKNKEPNALLTIAIQGCSTSGKSTIAEILKEIFKEKSRSYKPFVFSTDCFFKSDPVPVKDQNEAVPKGVYDYDNPGALDWNLMFKSIDSFVKKSDNIIYSSYDFKKCERSDVKLEKFDFNIIIAEGIFSHALFTDKTFNYNEFDPTRPSKIIKKELIPNPYANSLTHIKYFLPIFLDLPNKQIIENRLIVDRARTSRTEEESRRYTEQFVIKSTEKYVRKVKLDNAVVINGGSRNMNIAKFIARLFRQLNVDCDEKYVNDLIDKRFANTVK